MVYQGEDLSSILFRFDGSDFGIFQFEDPSDDAPSSISEDQLHEYGGSEYHTGDPRPDRISRRNSFLPGIMLSLSNRRKGAPHRSPLS